VLTEFAFLAVFLVFAVVVPTSMLAAPWALTKLGIKPHRPDRVKTDTYECGMPTIGGSWARFNFRYYTFALLFVILDVTVVFLYPWAVHVRALGWLGLGAMLGFVGILAVGIAYAWRRKALEWD
jgi:NADH-quinone oxidoreductase subunit A